MRYTVDICETQRPRCWITGWSTAWFWQTSFLSKSLAFPTLHMTPLAESSTSCWFCFHCVMTHPTGDFSLATGTSAILQTILIQHGCWYMGIIKTDPLVNNGWSNCLCRIHRINFPKCKVFSSSAQRSRLWFSNRRNACSHVFVPGRPLAVKEGPPGSALKHTRAHSQDHIQHPGGPCLNQNCLDGPGFHVSCFDHPKKTVNHVIQHIFARFGKSARS